MRMPKLECTRRELVAGGIGAAATVVLGGGAWLLTNGGRRGHPEQQVNPGTCAEHDIRRHLLASRTRILTAAQIQENGNKECIDGRSTQTVVGTPGGDAGDLIMKIAATENAHGQPFTDAQVGQIFDRYLQSHHGNFYMHTDDHGLEHALTHMPQGMTKEELEQMIDDPGRNQAVLLAALTQSDSIGCGHIKRMLTHPREYPGIRPELVRACIRKFFREKWGKNQQIDYAKLHGEHAERAVLRIRKRGGLQADSAVPLVQPNVRVPDGHGSIQSSVFLLHPDVEAMDQTAWVENAREITGVNGHIQRLPIILADYRSRYLAATAEALASGKPVFDAEYDDNPHVFAVRRAA